MSTFLKVLGFIALGVVALLALGLVFHLAASLLHLVVPLAVLAGIGFAAWKIFGSKAAMTQPEATGAPQQSVAKPTLPASPAASRPSLSDEEARRQFEELRKKQSS